jgi:hypothetical protein
MRLCELHGLVEPGQDAGTCYVCGATTETGWRGAPSGKFTAFSSCFAGDVVCEGCQVLLKDRRFRVYSWVMSRAWVAFADKEHRSAIWSALLDPPAPPWAMYQTQAGQKQGWLSIAACVNESRNAYRVAVDWLDRAVLMDARWVSGVAPVVAALREAKVTKDSLRSGSWSMRDYRRALEADLMDEYRKAYKLAGDPRWEVLVNAHYVDADAGAAGPGE